jgi:hypothetical protein
MKIHRLAVLLVLPVAGAALAQTWHLVTSSAAPLSDGAHTATATANAGGGQATAQTSVQLVQAGGGGTSTQCPATPPAEAQQAGFTTMALCNDFTQPIPNTAGTGLPSDWRDCDNGFTGGNRNDNVHVWYQTIWYLGYGRHATSRAAVSRCGLIRALANWRSTSPVCRATTSIGQ